MRIKNLSASASVHLSTVLFGLSAVLVKGMHLPAVAIVAGRALWAVLLLSVVIVLLRQSLWRSITVPDLVKLLVNGALLAGHWACFFIGVQEGGVAVGTLGFACFPVFVSFFDWLVFKARITVADVVCMVLIVLGLVVISLDMLHLTNGIAALFWALGAGLSYAIIVLYNRHVHTDASPLQASLLQCVGCAIVSVPFGYPALLTMALQDFVLVMFIGVLCTGVAYTMLTFALKKIAAGKAAMMITLEPVWAILFAAVLFHVWPDIKTLAGGGLIVLAVMLNQKYTAA